METPGITVLSKPQACVCCGTTVAGVPRKQPLCGACVEPGTARSYCAKCGKRGEYPFEDFMRVVAKSHPGMELAPGVVVRLPACADCKDDGRPMAGDRVLFYGIEFD